jgi:hypothetical protein
MAWIPGVSPRMEARVAAVFYLVTFVAGTVALLSAPARLVAHLIA